MEKFEESKVIRRLIKTGIILAVFFLTLQLYVIFDLSDLYESRQIIENYTEFYEFEPNSSFSKEAGERFEVYTTEEIQKFNGVVYTEYLAKWSSEPDVEILRLQPYIYYRQKDFKVLTYMNFVSYENAWDDFTLPLKEGRWFEGSMDEVICINDSSYEIGDEIQIENEEGKTFLATVVGKADYPYLYNNLSMSSNLTLALHKYDNTLDVFLLNPQSVHNRKSDLINFGTTFIKTENDAFISKIGEYGTCTPISMILINQKVDFLRPVLIMGISILALTLLLAAEFILKCFKGTGWCIWVAGIFAYICGSILYAEVEYKLILAGIICALITLIYLLAVKCVNRQKKQITGSDIIVIETEDIKEEMDEDN